MNNSRYTLDNKQVSDVSLRDLARRSRYGGIFYLMAFWASVFSSVSARENIDIITFFSGSFLILQGYRLVLFFKIFSTPEINLSSIHRHFLIIYSASAFVWVGSAAWLFYINPVVDIAITVNVMSAAGISIGGVTVLAPSYKIMRIYCGLICLPFALAAAVFLNGPENWIIVCLILFYGLFIFLTGKQQSQDYWKALNDNVKLSIQAHELEKAKVEAELAGQAKADFLAAMTHEIRTPMNGILGMAQLLAMENLNKVQRQQVNIINSAGRTLMRLINDILDYSKINADQLELEKCTFSPRKVIDEVMLLLSPQFKEKAITLSCVIDDVPEFVQGDPYRLHQILYNLVGNAFKFTEQGEVSITLSCCETDDDDTFMMSFSISDTGVGITPSDQQQIFDQFYQVDPFNSNIRGTGLGLSITQRVVGLMGGTISLKSNVGVGSTFTVTLPFTLGIEEQNGTSFQPSSEQGQHNIERPRSLHILLVEDNDINQMLCEQFLLKLGCTVDLAKTGVAALEKFNGTQRYDAILMDCNMPEMDGFSATLLIREIEREQQIKETPIVALTAHIGEDIKQKCLASGMNVFLSKPFLFEDLDSIIRRIRSGYI